MSTAANSISEDINTLDRLAEGEEDARTVEELSEKLERPESVVGLLDEHGEAEPDKPVKLSQSDYESVQEGLRELEEDYSIIEGGTTMLTEENARYLDSRFLPGLVSNPGKEGYEEVNLEGFSTELLGAMVEGEVEHPDIHDAGTAGYFIRGVTGSSLSAAGKGVAASGAVWQALQLGLVPDNPGSAVLFFAGMAAIGYGETIKGQAESYREGMRLRIREEYNSRRAEKLLEKYGDREIVYNPDS